MSIMQTMLQSPRFRVIDHVCKHPRIDCGYSDGDEPARFVFTRRGSFEFHAGGKACFARPGQVVLVPKGVEYRVSHPDAAGCDCCTDVCIHDGVLDMLGIDQAATQPRQFGHDLQFQKAHVEMFLGLRTSMAAGQDADDEVLVDALACLLSPHAAQRPSLRKAASVRQVARVEEAILGHPEQNLGIDALAELAGCSVFHLCRTFRSMTGQSLRQYRMRHRIGTALARLGEGEDDLAGLACDLGFSSHSHMTDAFREWLGVTPREVRDDLRRSDLRALQARLRAVIDTRAFRGA